MIEANIAAFRQLQQEIDAIRRDFFPGEDVQVCTEALEFHLRRQIRELQRHIRAAVQMAFGRDSVEYAEVQSFGALEAAPRSFADYFFFVDRCLFQLEQERLQLSEGQLDLVVSGIDAITDAYTEPLMRRLLEQEVAWAERKGEALSLLRLRFRDWTQIQRRYSTSTTKELIIGLACIFKTALRPYDFVCRLAPDQFGIVLREADAITVSMVGGRIITAFQSVVTRAVGGDMVTIEVATGTYPFEAESATELLSRTEDRWTVLPPHEQPVPLPARRLG